jgi:hypothetical protein
MYSLQIITFLFSSIFTQFLFTNSSGEKEASIQINKGDLSLNEIQIDPKWNMSSFQNILGQVERVQKYAGLFIDIYDSKGIIVFENRLDTTKVAELQVYFSHDSDNNQLYPYGFFTGTVSIEGFPVTSNTSLKEMIGALPKYKFRLMLGDIYRGSYKGLYLFAKFDKTGENLLMLATGMEKIKYKKH